MTNQITLEVAKIAMCAVETVLRKTSPGAEDYPQLVEDAIISSKDFISNLPKRKCLSVLNISDTFIAHHLLRIKDLFIIWRKIIAGQIFIYPKCIFRGQNIICAAVFEINENILKMIS